MTKEKVNPMRDLCSDDEYVRSELVEARRLMGLRKTNLENLSQALGFMYLYCNETMRDMVLTTLDEVTLRGMYATMIV